MFNKRWPLTERLWDDLNYYREDGFEVGALSPENITLWRQDNGALRLSLEASEARSQGDLQRARRLVEEACQADSRCKEVLMFRTKILSELEDNWGVINSLVELVALDPLYYEGYILAAQYLEKLGHLGEALKLLEVIAVKDDLPFDIAEQVAKLIADRS
jgi:tetratricopeptide (TPR) repeat protein